jgi:hypothetical protein
MIKINVVFMLKSVDVKSTLRTEATLEDTPGGHLGGHLVDTLEGTYGRHLGGTPGGHLGGPLEDTPGRHPWFLVWCPPGAPFKVSSKVSSNVSSRGVLQSILHGCSPKCPSEVSSRG